MCPFCRPVTHRPLYSGPSTLRTESSSPYGLVMNAAGTGAARHALARRLIAMIDLTDLSETSSPADVERLCARATDHQVAAVCVWPEHVRRAGRLLAGSEVRVATVVNFPSGDGRAFDCSVITDRVIADGADEVDLVLPYRAVLTGDHERAGAVLDAVRAVVPHERHLKVILETGELGSAELIGRAARLAIDHGADFGKTSTGQTKVSATPEAVTVMAREVASASRPIGIKPSGGIRTLDDAAALLHAVEAVLGAGWATPANFRLGASSLLDALLAE